MSAELAARRTAAAAVLGDFRSEYNRYLGDPVNARCPDYPVWALRLAAGLGALLERLADEAAEDPAGAQLDEVRSVLDVFTWGVDDLQYALEQVDAIVNRSKS